MLLDRLLFWARRLSRYGTWVGGVVLFAAVFVVGFEVVARKLFAISVGGADELAGYALAISSSWAMSLTLLDRAHIRVDSLYGMMPVRAAAVLDLLSLFAFALLALAITVYGYGVFATSWRVGATSMSALAVPVAWPQLLWVLGFAFFFSVIVLLFTRALILFVRGEIPAMRSLVGSRSAQEETEAELAELDRSGQPA